jgi:hypothetical protein
MISVGAKSEDHAQIELLLTKQCPSKSGLIKDLDFQPTSENIEI